MRSLALGIVFGLSLAVVAQGCGPGSGTSGSSAAAGTGAGEPPAAATARVGVRPVEGQGVGGVSPKAGAGACLSDCATPAAAQYSFTGTTVLTPAACSVEQISVYDNAVGLLVLFRGDCGAKSQVYALTAGYDGAAPSAALLVSSVCQAAGGDVVDFASAQGDTGYMASFACDVGLSFATAYVAAVSPTARSSAAQVIETVAMVPPSYQSSGEKETFPTSAARLIAWNGTANAYGLARVGSMQRLDQTGRALGGAVTFAGTPWLSGAWELSSVTVHQGRWLLLRGGVAFANGETYCSRIDPLGIPQCNDKDLTSRPGEVTADNHLVGADAGGRLYVSAFDPATCTAGPAEALGSLNDSHLEQYYGTLDLAAGYGAMLYTTKDQTLKIAVYSSSPTYSLASEVSVANAPEIGSAKVQLIRQHIYVAFVAKHEGLLAISEQATPP